MALPAWLEDRLRLPLIGAPMFIVSGPELVIAQCQAGIIGAFPALNARPKSVLDEWLRRINDELDAYAEAHAGEPVAPYAVNQIVHGSNTRLAHDLDVCVKHEVPIIITSLRPPADVVAAVHDYGGLVFHDVISLRHTMKAIDQGVDGIVAVTAGAGGHAGNLNPFALVAEIRREFDGTVILSGSLTSGADILAAEAIGADLAYMGTRFIATAEANAVDAYKQMIVDSSAADIVYTPYFTGIHGSYLRGSIERAGLDPDTLDPGDRDRMDFGQRDEEGARAWKDIWGAGQGVGTVDDILPARDVVMRLETEYRQARERLGVA